MSSLSLSPSSPSSSFSSIHVLAKQKSFERKNEARKHAEKLFFEEALMRKSPRARMLLDGTPWECKQCGCSEEFSFDAEKICGCDTCYLGCESAGSRLARGAKRPEAMEEAMDLCETLAERCEQLQEHYYFLHQPGGKEDDMLNLEIQNIDKALSEINVPVMETFVELVRDILSTCHTDVHSLFKVQMLLGSIRQMDQDVGPFRK